MRSFIYDIISRVIRGKDFLNQYVSNNNKQLEQ